MFRSPIILLSHDYILLISLEERHGGVVALHRLVDFWEACWESLSHVHFLEEASDVYAVGLFDARHLIDAVVKWRLVTVQAKKQYLSWILS